MNQFLKRLLKVNNGPYYEDLYLHPLINIIEFPDCEYKYKFEMSDFIEIEVINTVRNVVKRYLHKPSKKELAIKFINLPHSRFPKMEEEKQTVKTMLRDVQNLYALRNTPNIVNFFGFCILKKEILICMEHMDMSLKVILNINFLIR